MFRKLKFILKNENEVSLRHNLSKYEIRRQLSENKEKNFSIERSETNAESIQLSHEAMPVGFLCVLTYIQLYGHIFVYPLLVALLQVVFVGYVCQFGLEIFKAGIQF